VGHRRTDQIDSFSKTKDGYMFEHDRAAQPHVSDAPARTLSERLRLPDHVAARLRAHRHPLERAAYRSRAAAEKISLPATSERRAELQRILKSKGLAGSQVERCIRETLELAAGQQIYSAKWRQQRGDRAHAVRQRKTLRNGFERLADHLEALPKGKQRELNGIYRTCVVQAKYFDSETLLNCLEQLNLLLAPLTTRGTPEARERISSLTTAWQAMLPESRLSIEAAVRRAAPRRGLAGLLRLLVRLLQANPAKCRHPIPRTQEFAHAVAQVWRQHGLQASSHPERESPFQLFCKTALQTYGDRSAVSRHQVLECR
jgi:hypothetical protein